MSFNVLITAASRRVALVHGFHRALLSSGRSGRVIAADVNALSPAVHMSDRAYEVPLSSDASYLDAIERICEAERIRLIVPTIDDELPIFGRARERFGAQGIVVAVSPTVTAEICNDKYATCMHLQRHGVAAANSFLPATLPPDPPLPLFVKPRCGRGSIAAFPVQTRRELEFFVEYVPDPVVQTFLAGPEFTIDMLCDFRGRPLSVVPRERVVIRAGVMDRGRTVRDDSLIELGLACARALEFHGAVNVQCRMVDGRPVVFEINPRFSGGIALTVASGADFPRMLLDLARGTRVRPAIGRFVPDLWMTNFESSLYLTSDRMRALAPLPLPATGRPFGATAPEGLPSFAAAQITDFGGGGRRVRMEGVL